MNNVKSSIFKTDLITADEFKQKLVYERDTGIIRWKQARDNKSNPGRIAGSLKKDGYIDITFNGITVQAHRVAWCMFYGSQPVGLIDQINGKTFDNAIINLRLCDKRQNRHNSFSRLSATGFKGVVCLKNNRFQAQIDIAGKNQYLGFFTSAEEAAKKYDEVAIVEFGIFANLNFPLANYQNKGSAS